MLCINFFLSFSPYSTILCYNRISGNVVSQEPCAQKNQAKPKTVVKENCGFVMHVKDIFCKKIGSKRYLQPSAVVRRLLGVTAANKMIKISITDKILFDCD